MTPSQVDNLVKKVRDLRKSTVTQIATAPNLTLFSKLNAVNGLGAYNTNYCSDIAHFYRDLPTRTLKQEFTQQIKNDIPYYTPFDLAAINKNATYSYSLQSRINEDYFGRQQTYSLLDVHQIVTDYVYEDDEETCDDEYIMAEVKVKYYHELGKPMIEATLVSYAAFEEHLQQLLESHKMFYRWDR